MLQASLHLSASFELSCGRSYYPDQAPFFYCFTALTRLPYLPDRLYTSFFSPVTCLILQLWRASRGLPVVDGAIPAVANGHPVARRA